MKIIADRHIPLVREAFSTLGDVHLVEGQTLTGRDVRDAEALVLRTVTRVDEALLEGSRVRLIAAASSGIDHIDGQYLARRGITLVSAAGCNARPVAEYVLSALCVAMEMKGMALQEARVGIIGCGHAGSMVYSMLRELEVDCVPNDPPLAEAGNHPELRPLEEAMQADAVTLHVPLTLDGPHRTRNLVNEAFLARLRPGTLLLNTARGEVVDEAALRKHLAAQRATAVIDVWTGEPEIDVELLRHALIATPHIAGYSQNAKWRATEMVYRGACAALGIQPAWRSPVETAELPRQQIRIDGSLSDREALEMAVLSSYDVRSDSVELRRLPQLPADERAPAFTTARDSYVPRAEFPDVEIETGPGRPVLAARLAALGFHVAGPGPSAGESAST